MSLFRKPKKLQRRVFSSALDEEGGSGGDGGERMETDETEMIAPPPPKISIDRNRTEKKEKSSKEAKKSSSSSKSAEGPEGGTGKSVKTKALLSFVDDEDEAEIFQVRKSSHSKKVMRQLDKERRKKKKEERDGGSSSSSLAIDSYGRDRDRGENGGRSGGGGHSSSNLGSLSHSSSSSKYKSSSSSSTSTAASSSNATAGTTAAAGGGGATATSQCKSKKSDSIQTEIRTDDFVLVVKKFEPSLILNGRAASCAGRNDMSDESDNNESEPDGSHRFSKPEELKQMLESGSIPDAAMIFAARKRRQKAREQSDFIPVEEPKEVTKKGSRLAREDVEGDQSDDEERVDMNAITGIKEREERREQFYSVENDYSEEDSDRETNEWENQQIRKGVTGAQLVSAQHESVLSRFMITPASMAHALEYTHQAQPQSTSTLLEQAYAKSALQKPQQLLAATKIKKDKSKAAALRTPQEIRDVISTRLTKIKELNSKHNADIQRINSELKVLKLEELDCSQKAPTAAAKYRFYQEVKCYVSDLVDCLNEKAPLINDLEKRTLQTLSKHQNFLIERRRQDVRDQAKEIAEVSKLTTMRRGPEYEEQVRRTAEREGRRTRRRYEREKNELLVSHLDGMSSDDETSDRYQEMLQTSLEQIDKEAEDIFNDVTDEFCKVELILMKFFAWRKTDMESYKDAFVSLCLPKILGPIVRLEMLSWSPLLDEYKDIENMNWHTASMLYAWSEHESEDALKLDPDINLVPTVIEKIILPKVTEIVHQCWDPLSTTQTLRLIGFINRLGREYPFKENSKSWQQLFKAILEKMKLALENDVFIPIFPKQVQEAKTSFFQRQFCSGLKLFRNFLSWQGIIADKPLRELAIGSLLNRYLLMAMRVCSANDAISKAYVVVNTLPTVWLQPDSATITNMQLFITYIKQTLESCDAKNPVFVQSCDKAKQILQRLHSF